MGSRRWTSVTTGRFHPPPRPQSGRCRQRSRRGGQWRIRADARTARAAASAGFAAQSAECDFSDVLSRAMSGLGQYPVGIGGGSVAWTRQRAPRARARLSSSSAEHRCIALTRLPRKSDVRHRPVEGGEGLACLDDRVRTDEGWRTHRSLFRPLGVGEQPCQSAIRRGHRGSPALRRRP